MGKKKGVTVTTYSFSRNALKIQRVIWLKSKGKENRRNICHATNNEKNAMLLISEKEKFE